MVDSTRGSLRIRAWPKKRPGPRNPTNEFWSRWLKAITYVYRYQPAEVQFQLQRATQGTVWMPRDIFISSARGRAFALTDQYGRKYFPMPYVVDVSESLDTVGQFEGMMMFRGTDLWSPIPIGPSGHVLTSLDGYPQWQPPASGGGTGYLRIPLFANVPGGRIDAVNSTSYITREWWQFYVDCDELPFTHFRFAGYFGANQFGQSVTGQLTLAATPSTPLSTAGDDWSVLSAQAPVDTGWIAVDSVLTGWQRLGLAVKGSNGTVDLGMQYMEIHLKVA